jgi:O-antigen ligase
VEVNPKSLAMDYSPDTGNFTSSQASPEKVFYGGLGLLVAFAVYVPLQLKIDARLGLSSIAIPGLAVINLLFALSLWKVAQNKKPKPDLDSASSRLGSAIFIFGMFSVLALLVGTVRTSGSTFPEDFTIWKRWFSMLFLYVLTRKFLHSELQLRRLLIVISVVLAFASVNLLRENLSTGMSSETYREGLRFGGVFDWGGENDLGAFFSEFIFIPLVLYFMEKNLLKRAVFLSIAVIVGVGCIFTYSRASWIGLAVGLIAYFGRRTKAGLLLVAALAFLLLPLLPASVVGRWQMTRDAETGKVEASGQMRLDVWNEGIRLIEENPLTGVGFNRFRYEVRLKNFSNMHLEPHNAYIKVAAEEGIPALLAFIFLLVAALRCSGEAKPGIHRELACAFTGFWFAFISVNFFGNRILREGLISYFMIFCGIMVWLRTEHQKRSEAAEVAP